MILYPKTIGCGCKLQDYGKGSLRIKYCPKHAAGDDLYEQFKDALLWIDSLMDSDDFYAPSVITARYDSWKDTIAQAAIARATVQD